MESALIVWHLFTRTTATPNVSLLDNLVRLSMEGNPLKRLKNVMRTAGAKALKEFLKLQLGN